MRISTSMIHANAVSSLMKNQAALAKTQSEVSSGLRVQKPSDDPVAAVKILQLEQTKSANTQYGTNISSATTRLDQEEQALADSETILQRVHELGVQANSSALSQSDRQSIATELTALNKQLADVGNRKDSNGEYLFAGLSAGTQPFSRDASNNISYAGDGGVRNIQVSASQYVQDGDSGQTVFMSVPQGNGTFVSTASSTNTGTGIISGSVQNAAAWVPDDYTLTFSSPTDWQITDSSSAVVSSGTGYVAGTAIAFNGIQVSLTGSAAAGDTFAVNKSRSEDIFTTIDGMVAALNSPLSTDANKASFQNQINKSLQQLDQAESHFLNVRTSVGARSSMLDNVSSTREDSALQIETALSTLSGSNSTEAISRFTQQTLSLQAAQQSYVKIAQLSMFNYL